MVCSKCVKTEWWQNLNAGNWFKITYFPKTSWFKCGIQGYYTWWAWCQKLGRHNEHQVYYGTTYINNAMQIAFLKIRQISYYRKFLTPSAAETLIHAYITSRLDYCNGLLHGLPTNLVAKLQSILNTAARLVTKTRKYEHIAPVMINLHWLPIQYRIQFKLLLLIYKSLHGLSPSYLTDELSLRPNKGLRSYNQLLLNIPVSTLIGLNFMEIGLSLLPDPHSGMHFL